jgi:hypothetical protein
MFEASHWRSGPQSDSIAREHILLAKGTRLRLLDMKRVLTGPLSLGLLSLALSASAAAQTSLPPNQVSLKGDTSLPARTPSRLCILRSRSTRFR